MTISYSWEFATRGSRGSAAPGSGGGGEASGLQFPMGYDDPIFTGMSEYADTTLNTVANTTYTKHSSTYTGGNWAILMNDNVTFNYMRLICTEGPRYRGYTGTAFNWCYLECGDTAPTAHADGSQWESGDNSVTWKNCHFRATAGNFTLQFASDGSTGQGNYEDCLFSCVPGTGQNAVRYDNDTGTNNLRISMKNCYIQTESDWLYGGPIVLDAGPYVTQVVLWENVRWCTWNHTTKTLVPGDLIPSP